MLQGSGGAVLPRYHMALPTRDDHGDWEAAALYSGRGVGNVADELPVAALIERLMTRLG